MVGVLVVSHYRLGEEMLQALRLIVPDGPPFHAVGIDPGMGVDEMRAAISKGLDEADRGEGVLVLTDMFGGTPSNLAISVLGQGPVEVIAGINLPMLIKLATLSDEKPLEELAPFIKSYGQRNVSLASEILPDDGS